uniref:Uncharacterized protein n=1 Tax=Tanacetum cinerariifolium TaxID=118510 RepID=A0A6L2KHN9_TANCI|nr:hypothetical protein [Tanacetum cinerariifolium]
MEAAILARTLRLEITKARVKLWLTSFNEILGLRQPAIIPSVRHPRVSFWHIGFTQDLPMSPKSFQEPFSIIYNPNKRNH